MMQDANNYDRLLNFSHEEVISNDLDVLQFQGSSIQNTQKDGDTSVINNES